MKVDYGFILAAGFGTRMGEIGKFLPKLLWPVLNKRLVELQYNFLKDLGAQKIYINSHFLHNELEKFIKENLPDLHILYEDEVFDVGGGVLNFARHVNFKGKALIVNGDQFLIFNKKIIEDALAILQAVTLFGTKKNSNDGYNRLDLRDDILIGITKNNEIARNQELITYSGMALFDLTKIEDKKGKNHKFFESVANFNEKKISVKTLGEYEYWDFGTVDRYINSHFELMNKRSNFHLFLEKSNCFKNYKFENDKFILKVADDDFFIERDRVVYKGTTSILL